MHWWTLQQLRSKKPATRLAAVAKLAADGSAGALALLEGLLEQDPDANVRMGALQAAATFQLERSLEVVLKGLQDSEPAVRETAARLLGRSGQSQAIPALVTVLQDRSSGVRRQAALALDALGWQPQDELQRLQRSLALGEFQELTSRGAAAVELLIAALKDPQYPKRQLALEALSQTGDARALQPIIAALKDADPHLRVAAAEALGRMRETRAVEPLIASLRDKDAHVRAAAAAALGHIGASGAVPALIQGLKDEQWSVRQAAVEALGRLHADVAVEPLLPLLKDRDKDVRYTTAQVLGNLGDQRAVQALVEALTDVETPVRRAAAAALEQIDPEWPRTDAARQAVPALKAAQQHRDYWVRQAATEALARIQAMPVEAAPEPSAVSDTMLLRRRTATELFIELLADPDRDLRLAAASSLGRLGARQAVTPLIAALEDEDVSVREAAFQALTKLGWAPAHRPPAGNSGPAPGAMT